MMIRTICLHRVLQEAVATPYRNLVTRATGAAVRNRIEAELAEERCLTALLDFSNVELLDFSCADEIVAKLLLGGTGPGPVLALTGVREEQRETLEHVLIHHRLAIVARLYGDERDDLLGSVTPDARTAFATLRAGGPAGPPELADRLSWPASRAVAALADLARHRLATPVDGRYHPPALP